MEEYTGKEGRRREVQEGRRDRGMGAWRGRTASKRG